MLVNKCRIYDEDNHTISSHYKSVSDKRNGNLNHGKPYGAPSVKGKQKDIDKKRPTGEGTPAYIKCYNYGKLGHRANECMNRFLRCFNFGKNDHRVPGCKNDGLTCYNCGEQVHISMQCHQPEKTTTTVSQTNGRVFALSGLEVPKTDNLIRGTCFINNVKLIAIIDTGATHSFISLKCAKRLELELSSMVRRMVIDTPANGSVTTSMAFLSCLLNIYGKSSAMD